MSASDQALCFMAGANSIFSSDDRRMLTRAVESPDYDADRALLGRWDSNPVLPGRKRQGGSRRPTPPPWTHDPRSVEIEAAYPEPGITTLALVSRSADSDSHFQRDDNAPRRYRRGDMAHRCSPAITYPIMQPRRFPLNATRPESLAWRGGRSTTPPESINPVVGPIALRSLSAPAKGPSNDG